MKKTKFVGVFFSLICVFAVGALAQNTASSGQLCSKDMPDRRDVSVKLTNSTKTTINVHFVNYDNCQEFLDTPIFTANPGQTLNVTGQHGVAYRIREAGTKNLLKEIILVPNMPQINITAAAPAAVRPKPANLPAPKDEVIYVFKNEANVTNCTPNLGWAKCIQLADPTIRIMATKGVSQSAMNGVANVYAEITRRLGPKYPRNKLDTFIVHMTNAEPWSELINLAPIGMAYPQQPYQSSGDFLRGYGNPDNLWITEQMICKTGVKTRNDTGKVKDNQARTFDQVIHEFGHSIDSNFLTRQQAGIFKFATMTPLESFAYHVTQWFRSPDFGVSVPANNQAVLKELFTTQATFSCDGYKP